ncbi:DUF6491 family protein [Shewanella sp. GXUN23E]|uniref:DUF6491 family protein n=1 Tax=Shewanella sp. GXUN23E TaxID=3422498 RepID=UPI003D7DEA52
MELNGRCPGLDFATRLLIRQSISSSLTAKLDAVIPDNGPEIFCQISKIYPLGQEQANALITLDNLAGQN